MIDQGLTHTLNTIVDPRRSTATLRTAAQLCAKLCLSPRVVSRNDQGLLDRHRTYLRHVKVLILYDDLGRDDILCSSLAQLTTLVEKDDNVDRIVSSEMYAGEVRSLYAVKRDRQRQLCHGFMRRE